MKIGLFYGTTLGTAKAVADMIAKEIEVEVFDVANGIEELNKFDSLIFGTNTWGYGDLQDDWERVLKDLKNIDFTGKKVAIYSTGDQESYPDTFVDSIGILADVVEAKGATIIGYTETDGYNFNESKAQKNGKFIGLAIDDNNQSSLTSDRVKKWVETLKGEF